MTNEYLDMEADDDTLVVNVRGDWVFENVAQLEADSLRVRDAAKSNVIFRCAGLRRMDIAGAWVLYDRSQQLTETGITSEFKDFRAAHFKFLRHIIDMAAAREPGLGRDEPERPHPFRVAMETVGEKSLERVEDTGQWTRWLFDALRRPSRLVIAETLQQIHQAGVRAIPVVMLMTFLIGIVLAFQGASQLERFGARIFVVDMVSIAVTREMAGLLAAVLVAGRSGSAFAAALGTILLAAVLLLYWAYDRIVGIDNVKLG